MSRKETVGGASDDQILKILDAAEANSKWVTESYDKLEKKYEGKIFAVKNKEVSMLQKQ